MTSQFENERDFLACFALLLSAAVACSSNANCGSTDDSAPGRCQAGVCQCGVGYTGNILIDPTLCTLSCSPAAVPDSAAFLRETNVTVRAAAGNLVPDISLLPYARQTPTSVAFLNPTNGSACALMPAQLGSGVWTQEHQGDCGLHYILAAPFTASVKQQCWEQLASSTESGPQYSATFNQYGAQAEVIQKGLAPFGQTANRRNALAARDDANLAQGFRRNYTISVATRLRPRSAPFSLIAELAVLPTVG
jgi:hypothetical protein